MYFIPIGILLKDWAGLGAQSGMDLNSLGWVSFLWRNLVPVTIGNIIGGVVFVGLSYWGAYLRPARVEESRSE
jgi:formate/nitrite transporter FocA (FNT family)